MLIEWNKSLSVGIESIDHQHQELIKIINKLYEAMGSGKANELMEPIFDELVSYTQVHFKMEEYLFHLHKYPEEVKHMSEHQYFIMEISDLQMDYFKGNTVAIKVTKFLKEWLVNHILVSDRAYAPYLKSKGEK